jgi:hypothetical protein
MATTLSADLASLTIDRGAKTVAGGPPKVPLGWLLFAAVAVLAYVKGKPYLEAQFFKTEVEVTEIARVSPAQASIELRSSGYVVPQMRSEVVAKLPGRVAKSLVLVETDVQVKFIDDPVGVLPDMAARVSFLSNAIDESQLQEKPKLVVPAAAVVERSGHRVVFVLDGDSVHMQDVTLGPPFGDGFELVAGPEPGTKVIKAPPVTLLDGQKVRARTPS